MGNENMTAAPSGTFRTGDGLLNIAANKQEQFVTLCGLIGRPELATDPRFAERETRKRNRREPERADRGGAGRAPGGGLGGNAQPRRRAGRPGADDPAGARRAAGGRAQDRQAFRRRCSDEDKPLTVVRGGFLVDGQAPLPKSPPPTLGEHMEEILGTLGKNGERRHA